jgi:CoA:oxalate CoA-transferase
MRPLQSIRVVDLSQILSGPFATQILADFGAEVIKVEPVWGDKARQNGPKKGNHSTYFASLNRGKKSVAINLKIPEGQALLARLAAASDVLIENFRPDVMTRLNLGYEALHKINPRLIYAACSGFGQSGAGNSRPALDIVIQAMAGTMSVTGTPDGEPIKVGFSVGDIGAGLYLALGVMAALQERQHSGCGCFVDVSMLESQVALLENAYARYFATNEVPTPLGSRHAVMAPFQAFATLDGYLVIAVSTRTHWEKLCEVLELGSMASDGRLSTSEGRVQHRDIWEEVLSARFSSQSTGYWMQRLEEAEIPAGPINTVEDASRESLLNERELFVEVDYGGVPFRVVGSPLRFGRKRPAAVPKVPELGADTEEILRTVLKLDAREITALHERGAIG